MTVTNEVVRIVSLCIVLACTETLHGIVRAAILVPKIGKMRALKISIISGSILAFGVCYILVPSIGISSTLPLIGLGCILAIFMASFDIALGKLLMHFSWRKIARDFNPATGNYLLYGLLLLVTYPYLVMKFYGVISH